MDAGKNAGMVPVTERRLHFKKESTPILTSHFGRVYFFDES